MKIAEVHFNRLLLPWRPADIRHETTLASYFTSSKVEKVSIQMFGSVANLQHERGADVEPKTTERY